MGDDGTRKINPEFSTPKPEKVTLKYEITHLWNPEKKGCCEWIKLLVITFQLGGKGKIVYKTS